MSTHEGHLLLPRFRKYFVVYIFLRQFFPNMQIYVCFCFVEDTFTIENCRMSGIYIIIIITLIIKLIAQQE